MTAASAMSAVNPFTSVNPMSDGSDNSSGSASTQSATISANDFLTLLVTEMQNQDPTAQTDPNEYINQLVQVNSLEQLIQINQNLSTAIGTTSSSATGQVSARSTDAANPLGGITAPASTGEARYTVTSGRDLSSRDSHNLLPFSAGNLSVPQSVPAAQRVAMSLSGQN